MHNKSKKDLLASLNILNSNIDIYGHGNKDVYRVVAGELRKLICDNNKKFDNSLIKRLFPGILLHKLRGQQNMIDSHTVLYIPGRIHFNGSGKSDIEELFDERSDGLTLEDWREQKLFDSQITIRELIRSVADKESAHSDEEYNATLLKSKSISLAGDDSLCAKTIIAIGRYVKKNIIKILSKNEIDRVVKFVNDNLNDISKIVKQNYANKDRGVLVIDLKDFEYKLSEYLSLHYEKSETILSYFRHSKEKYDQVNNLINNYLADSQFLFLVIDFNKELWLFQQKLL